MTHSHKRIRKIAEAVFRGKKTQYKFDVFPLSPDITDAPAVFIISRRVTDKFRKAHHSAVCLGETDSIRAEIKKHKRAKCVKQNAANVICILKDADETSRSVVVDDLQTARSFSCIRNADRPNIKAKPNVKTTTKSTPVNATAPKRAKTDNASARPAKAKPVKLSKPTKAKAAKPVAAHAKASKPVAAPPKKAKKSQPAKLAKPKTAKAKPAKKKLSKTAVAKSAKPKSSRAVAAKRPAAKRTKSVAPAKPKSPAKKPVAASPKRRTRVQSGVDSKRGQHRLSKPKKPVDRRAKSGTAGRSRSRKKAAA